MPKLHKIAVTLAICLGFYSGSTLASGQPTTQTERFIPHIAAPSQPAKVKPVQPPAKPTITRTSSDTAAVQTAQADAPECFLVFRVLADALGGDCYRDSNFHNPSPTGTHSETITEDVTETKDKSFKTHSKKAAKHFAGFLNKHSEKIADHLGYDDLEATAKGKKVEVTLSKTVQVSRVVQRRGDGPSTGSGGTASDSNGMAHGGASGVDSGNW